MGLGYLRLAGESIPGNETNSPTLATKKVFPRLLSFEPELGPSHLDRNDELVNTDEPVSVLAEAYDPTWSMRSRGYPDLIGIVLTNALGAPTTTAGDGIITDPDTVAIPAVAYRHVWTAPFGPSGASPKTFQADAAYSDQAVYFKLKGCTTSQISLESPESGGMMVGASGPALYMDKQTDPSLSAAYESESLPPFLRSHLTLPTWLAGSATFRDFGLTISIPNEVRHTAGSGSKYPDIVYKGDSPIVVSGSVPKELLDEQDFDALKAATGFTAKALWTSTAIIASAYPYKLFVQMSNAQYVEGAPDALANQRRRGATFGFRASRSGSASVTITLVNATASYA